MLLILEKTYSACSGRIAELHARHLTAIDRFGIVEPCYRIAKSHAWRRQYVPSPESRWQSH